jgi:hypothetical protein
MLGEFVLLGFIDKKSKEVRSVNRILRSSRVAIWLSQILLSALLVILLVQMISFSKYQTIILTAICCISYSISIAFTGILGYIFFSWFRRQKNAMTIIYGIVSVIIAVNLIITLLFSITVLSSRPDEVRQFLVSSGIFVSQDTFAALFNTLYQFSSVAMFLAMWFATAILLYYYSKRLGKIRFWILIATPLVYFLSQFFSSVLNVSISLVADPVLVGIVLTSLFTVSLVIGGVLFGIAFIRLSSRFSMNDAIRNYLIIAGYGFMFLLISNNGILLATVPYPPYAAQSVSFIGIASYSMLLGIHSSAIAVSNDIELRKAIRKFALGEGKLLDNIGTAEVQKVVEERASIMLKQSQKYMEEEMGFVSLTKDEVALQVESIMKELEEAKSKRDPRDQHST